MAASKILLVEDEPWLGELYKRLLEHHKFEVTWCRDGYEAIDCIDSSCPDLIVLDLILPWANGVQLLHELASHSDLEAIPVILYSNALSQNSNLDAMQHYGVMATLDKMSSSPQKLISMIKRVLKDADHSN